MIKKQGYSGGTENTFFPLLSSFHVVLLFALFLLLLLLPPQPLNWLRSRITELRRRCIKEEIDARQDGKRCPTTQYTRQD